MTGSAILSDCGRYRYRLTRDWSTGPTDLFASDREAGSGTPRTMTFVMLNPSTADATEDDPTVRRCIGFANRESCTRLQIVNLFAWRATDPDDLFDLGNAGENVIGPDNDRHIRDAVRWSHVVVAGWGANVSRAPWALARATRVRVLVDAESRRLRSLGLTKAGHPKHPLYLPKTAPLR